jgi:pantoate--beta-alanine ligase
VSQPRLLRSAAALRRRLRAGTGTVGFVPTMGALHAGHLSLVRRALRENPRVVVSVFVNPTQFGQREDFSKYPRTLAADRRLLAGLRAPRPLLLYAPPVEDVYPAGFSTSVSVGGSLGQVLEAAWRPGHFQGVATVVARLFSLVNPSRAYFGLKDYQQFLVLKRMVGDLGLPVEMLGCPTLRETDGLAMSSRNRRLDPRRRRQATALIQALLAAAALASRGETSAAKLRSAGLRVLRAVPGVKVQYFEVADPDSLLPLRRVRGQALALTACVLGGVRLIDNLTLKVPVHA